MELLIRLNKAVLNGGDIIEGESRPTEQKGKRKRKMRRRVMRTNMSRRKRRSRSVYTGHHSIMVQMVEEIISEAGS